MIQHHLGKEIQNLKIIFCLFSTEFLLKNTQNNSLNYWFEMRKKRICIFTFITKSIIEWKTENMSIKIDKNGQQNLQKKRKI